MEALPARDGRHRGHPAHLRAVETPGGAGVLVLTMFDLDEYVFAALRAGASGFLLNDTPRYPPSRPSSWGARPPLTLFRTGVTTLVRLIGRLVAFSSGDCSPLGGKQLLALGRLAGA